MATLAQRARLLTGGASTARLTSIVVLAFVVSMMPVAASAQDATPAATPTAGGGLEAAVAWLVEQQAEDGGFPGFDGTSDPGMTSDALSALAAAQAVGLDVAAPLADAYAFLEVHAREYAEIGAGQAAKLALAAVAAGEEPRDVGGVTPLELVTTSADPGTGLYGTGVFDHALGILALAAAGEPVPPAAFDALAATQLPDGSWAFDGSTVEGAGDSNTTALVVQALVAAGQADSPLIEPAIGHLTTVQTESGAFGYQPGDPTTADANSTALAVQALIAAGPALTKEGSSPAAPDLRDAVEALAAFQNPSGAFRYTDELPDDNLFATVQAIPALAGLPLPIVPDGAAGATPAA